MRSCLWTRPSRSWLSTSDSSSPLTRESTIPLPQSTGLLRFRPYIKGLPITATTLSRHPNGDFSEETIRPTYEDYYTLMFKELHRCLSGDAEIKTTVLDCECRADPTRAVD